MQSDFSFISTHEWRSWGSILKTNATLGSAAATLGVAAAGIGGSLAAIPFIFNAIKSASSRILADNAWIETRYGFVATEVIATALIVSVTVLALSILTPATPAALLVATLELALPMLAETLATQLTTAETLEEALAGKDDAAAETLKKRYIQKRGAWPKAEKACSTV